MGRVGDPFEIGQIASFLASDAASYITGQVLPLVTCVSATYYRVNLGVLHYYYYFDTRRRSLAADECLSLVEK